MGAAAQNATERIINLKSEFHKIEKGGLPSEEMVSLLEDHRANQLRGLLVELDELLATKTSENFFLAGHLKVYIDALDTLEFKARGRSESDAESDAESSSTHQSSQSLSPGRGY